MQHEGGYYPGHTRHSLGATHSPAAIEIGVPSHPSECVVGRYPFRENFSRANALSEPLIVERVKAGLRNASAKGKRLGRPPRGIDRKAISALRAAGATLRDVAEKMEISVRTARRVVAKVR